MNQKLYIFCLRFVQITTLLLTGILLASGALATCFSTDMETQKVLTKWDNPFFTIPATALFCLILFAISTFLSRRNALTARRILRIFVLCWCALAGFILILFSKTVPAADAYSVYGVAESLAAGDTSVIHPTDSYLSYYPQQIGLAAFWEILIRIWNVTQIDQHSYHFIKIIYVLLGCAIVLLQEQTAHILWNDDRADCIFLLLAGANFPLLMYTSFVYGEIPSFTALSAFFYFLARLLSAEDDRFVRSGESDASAGQRIRLGRFPHDSKSHDSKPHRCRLHNCRTYSCGLYGCACLFFLALSVMLRKNSLIFVIAAVLVLIIWGLRRKRPGLLLLAVLCAVFSLAILPCIQKIYEYRSGSRLNSGVPAYAYFAMGMQESSRANGWYNGFNFNTYQETGMNTESTVAISREAIRERLDYFEENPGYAARFYLQKYLSQWTDGTYACRQATLATFGGRAAVFVSLYEGEYSKFVIQYCNIYQNVIYLGAFWFCLEAFRRKKRSNTFKSVPGFSEAKNYELPVYLGLIGVLGGFLFHMIWEANSRYIFLYGLTLLPYAAKGLSVLAGGIVTMYSRKSNNSAQRAELP